MVIPIQSTRGSSEYLIGGEFRVNRLGYGTMQLTGPGTWGYPGNPDEAVRVLRRAVDLGVNFLDTADSYGPVVAEELIKRALHPYPSDLVIATKAGLARPGPGIWQPLGRPEYLRQQVEMSLRHLGVERIPLFQLHRIDPKVPLEDQVGELKDMRASGKIGSVGLSKVTLDQLKTAQAIVPIATVQNLYNVAYRSAEAMVDYTVARDIGFIPWFPLADGKLVKSSGPLRQLAADLGVTPSQLSLAWLLRRSQTMLPIPGTSKIHHLEENVAATQVVLSDREYAKIETAAATLFTRKAAVPGV
jgi:aryl-alcohol dehydrogenase-like predicted oxidoreductase